MDSILVVDDDPGLRELLLSALRFAGFAVEAAGDVPAALRRSRPAPRTRSCWT